MWMTPVANDDNKTPEAHMAMKRRMKGGARKTITSLQVQAKMWATPTAHDSKDTGAKSEAERKSPGLCSPAISHSHLAQATTQHGKPSRTRLNQRFVEWLMGIPREWTDCDCAATESFRAWLRSHSSNLRDVLSRRHSE